jgi:hypothetical protein
MDNENKDNKNQSENKPVFMEVSMENWEHLTSEQKAEIVDRIYSGFMRNVSKGQEKDS